MTRFHLNLWIFDYYVVIEPLRIRRAQCPRRFIFQVLKSIDKLFGLGVTVQHLQDTGVGRTVNALRKEPGEVGTAARALVNKWKAMVAAEESDQDPQNNESKIKIVAACICLLFT